MKLEVLCFLHILRQIYVSLSRLHGRHGKRGWLDSLSQIFRSTDTLACPHNVEIESASVDCSRDQDKKENGIPVVSVSNRGKRIVNYSTSTRIYTVDYEIKGDRGKMFGKTIEVENVP